MCLIAGMAVYQIASATPRNFAIALTKTISPRTNKTVIFFDRSKLNHALDIGSILASYSIPTFICFVIVVIGTVFLISKFKRSLHVRDSMTGSTKGLSKVSPKDLRLVRSVIFICTIYIIGAAPNVLLFVALMAYHPLHATNPRFGNITYLVLTIGILFKASSMSVNIFVYFRMSLKFRNVFKDSFLKLK